MWVTDVPQYTIHAQLFMWGSLRLAARPNDNGKGSTGEDRLMFA